MKELYPGFEESSVVFKPLNQTFGKFKQLEKENENYEKIQYFK